MVPGSSGRNVPSSRSDPGSGPLGVSHPFRGPGAVAMAVGNRPDPAAEDRGLAVPDPDPGNGRHAAICVVDLLEPHGSSVDDFAVSLLKLLEFVEHTKPENPGMRGSALLPTGGAQPPAPCSPVLPVRCYSAPWPFGQHSCLF